jgi:hypothetical protein
MFKAWHKTTREGLTLNRSSHKLSCRVGLVVEADHFGAWRDVMDDTSYKALIISRQDAKMAIWLVHQHFAAWLELVQQVFTIKFAFCLLLPAHERNARYINMIWPPKYAFCPSRD